jgi:hypothetical protein
MALPAAQLPALILLVVALPGCARQTGAPAPVITKLYPAESVAGRKFQVQLGDISAIAIAGKNFERGSKILFDGRPLDTAFGGPAAVTATVPDDLIARPAEIQVRVENPDGKASNAVPFKIRAQ